MGHKIILCVNERGILLTSLCSGGRGSAAGGRGTWVSHHSLEKRVSAGPVCKPAEVPATGGLAKPQPLWAVVFGAVNLCLLSNTLLCL